jgi:hypothetical protein
MAKLGRVEQPSPNFVIDREHTHHRRRQPSSRKSRKPLVAMTVERFSGLSGFSVRDVVMVPPR